MAELSQVDESKITALHQGLEAQILELPEEGRLKLFSQLLRQYCTRCGRRQPDKDFCKCGQTVR